MPNKILFLLCLLYTVHIEVNVVEENKMEMKNSDIVFKTQADDHDNNNIDIVNSMSTSYIIKIYTKKHKLNLF